MDKYLPIVKLVVGAILAVVGALIPNDVLMGSGIGLAVGSVQTTKTTK